MGPIIFVYLCSLANRLILSIRLEGSSKAQIITPRCITPTNETAMKKKKTEDTRKSLTKPKPEAKTSSKMTREPTPPPKQAPKNGNIFVVVFLRTTLFHLYLISNMFWIDNIFGNDLNLSDGTDSDGSEL